MDQTLFKTIKDEVRKRIDWEDGQATCYNQRFTGIRRAAKPYPGAPDTHHALIDTMIDKLRPFYLSQLYGQEHLSNFVSEKQQADEVTAQAEKLFDCELKQRSNFERAMFTSIDNMMMYGRGPVKVRWEDGKLQFTAIRPIFIIAPAATEELPEADWCVHVMHMSESQYRRNKAFTAKDEGFIKSITGKGGDDSGDSTRQNDDKLQRQGITVGEDDKQIVIWEVYEQQDDGTINVSTISPIAGPDKPIRADFGVPYLMDGKPFIPIVDIRYEITDQDYYSPRGVAEILRQDELELCKLRNSKLQYLDFHGHPQYTNEGTLSTPVNFKPQPGEILPAGIKPIPPVSAPMDFAQEIQMQRSLAEDRIQVPDLGASEHFASESDAKKTATGVNAIVAQSGAGNEMRSRVWKLQITALYKQAWSIFCMYSKGKKITLEDYTEVSPEALHDQYRIEPTGSADSASKEQRVAKAMALEQQFRGNPYVKQDEITKNVFEQDDPESVKRFYQIPAEAQQEQAEQQGVETLLMLAGRDAVVQMGDDDKAHVQDLVQTVQAKMGAGEPLSPDFLMRAVKHVQGHAQQMAQKKDKEGLAMIKQLEPMVQQLMQSIQQQPQPLMGGGAPPAPMGGDAAGGQTKESVSINYKDAPFSIQAQMEAQAGFHPAAPEERMAKHAMENPPPPPPAPKAPAAK